MLSVDQVLKSVRLRIKDGAEIAYSTPDLIAFLNDFLMDVCVKASTTTCPALIQKKLLSLDNGFISKPDDYLSIVGIWDASELDENEPVHTMASQSFSPSGAKSYKILGDRIEISGAFGNSVYLFYHAIPDLAEEVSDVLEFPFVIQPIAIKALVNYCKGDDASVDMNVKEAALTLIGTDLAFIPDIAGHL